MKKVQLLIIGTTVLGISTAVRHKNVMIIDSSMLCGAEYIHAYKYTRADMRIKDEVIKLYEPMKKMNIISDDGFVHLFPLGGILSGLLKDAHTDVRFLSSVLDIERKDGVYAVKILNKNGIETIIADKILDTTSEGTMHGHFSDCSVSRSVCGMLTGPAGTCGRNYSFVKGRFDDENILELNVPDNCSFDDARIMLGDLWHEIYTTIPDTRFATCAQRFAYDFSEPIKMNIEDGWIWIPSVSYGDIFTAFKEGMI